MIRATLLAELATQLSGTSVKVGSELPWTSGGTPLHAKNKKTLYVDRENESYTQLHTTLDLNDVFAIESTVLAYLTVDAKQQLSDIDAIIGGVIQSRLSVSSHYIRECSLESEIEGDEKTYTFEFRFVKVND